MLPAQTPADICNRAIQIIGGYDDESPLTGSPPNFDNTPAGLAFGTIYYECVQVVARRWGYDFARNIVTLALTDETAPYGFSYEYAYPTNGVQIRDLLPPTITDQNNPTPLRWVVGNANAPSAAAFGDIAYVSKPSATNTIVLNGVSIEWVDGGATGYQLDQSLCTIAGVLIIAVGQLNGAPPFESDPNLTVATYSTNGSFTQLVVNYDTLGAVGNTYTLATTGSGTPSGATLTGGANSQQRVIWTNLQSALATITNQPPESTWDPEFTEAVIELLAAKGATALDGKPQTAQLAMEASEQSQSLARGRTDS